MVVISAVTYAIFILATSSAVSASASGPLSAKQVFGVRGDRFVVNPSNRRSCRSASKSRFVDDFVTADSSSSNTSGSTRKTPRWSLGATRIDACPAATSNIRDTKRVALARRGKRTKQAAMNVESSSASADPVDSLQQQRYAGPEGEELTLEEMRRQLGPVGKGVAGAVEVGIVTAGSYLSGGVLGYVGGGLFGLGSLFRPADAGPPTSNIGAKPPLPSKPRGFGGEIRGRLGNVNSKAFASAKSWAQLSAAFSGFQAFTRVCRGGKEDRWNGIVGSAMTGAYLNRQGGPQAMVQGATTYASFTYLLDVFFGTKGKIGPDGTVVDDQFDYTEAELN